jgi:hypothetical protein
MPELRDLKVLDAQGNGDKQMLPKLYQPWNLGLDKKELHESGGGGRFCGGPSDED